MTNAFGIGEVSKKKDRGWGWDSDDAKARGQENYERKAAYVSRKGERRAKNWGRLGVHTGTGAGAGALIGGSMAAQTRNPRAIATSAGVGAAAGGAFGALSGTIDNDFRAQRDSVAEAESAGDFRAARKGERASEYHGGVIVPKKKYKKAQFKAMQAENQTLKERLSTVNKSAFGVAHPDAEVSKAFAFKPIVSAFKGGTKGAQVPFKPGTGLARAQSAGGAVAAGAAKAGQGLSQAATKTKDFAAARPKTAFGIGAGTAATATGVAGYKTGQRRSY